jgi:hypothetical protein
MPDKPKIFSFLALMVIGDPNTSVYIISAEDEVTSLDRFIVDDDWRSNTSLYFSAEDEVTSFASLLMMIGDLTLLYI